MIYLIFIIGYSYLSFFLHQKSSGLELSYGHFDVIFFPEKMNFFDASQENFEIHSDKMTT